MRTPFKEFAEVSKLKNGRGDRIRTCDPLVPNQMRYQAALLPDIIPALVAGSGMTC